MGRGYRVTAEQRAELQQALRSYYKVAGLVVLALVVVQSLIEPLAGKLIAVAVVILALTPWILSMRSRRRRLLMDARPPKAA
jgi:Flp pilus assembly protein TadB